MHPIRPIGPKTNVSVCFVLFGCIPFGCLTKLGAKRAELVQKFVPRIRVGIFRNERTRSTPSDPKLTFWCVSYYLGAFGTVWLPYETRCKTSRTSAKVHATKSRRNFFLTNAPDPPHWTLNWRFGVFCTIWVHSGPFGSLTNLGAKRAELVQKFVPRSRFGIFRNEHTQSTPSVPKLTFWCVSYYLGAFRTIWLPYDTRCKIVPTSAKVRGTKSRRNISLRVHPIHLVWP